MIDVEVTKAKERDPGESILKQYCEMEREKEAERHRWCVGRGDESKNIKWGEKLLGDGRDSC